MSVDLPSGIDLGKRIRSLREKRKLGGSQFARQCGIKPQSLLNIEVGRRRPSLSLLITFAAEFGMSLDALLWPRDDEDQEPDEEQSPEPGEVAAA